MKELGWIHRDHEKVTIVEDWPLAAAIYVCMCGDGVRSGHVVFVEAKQTRKANLGISDR